MDYQPQKFTRLIIKISGEFLAGTTGAIYDSQILDQLTDDIIEVKRHGYGLGFILGGGNLCRGKDLKHIDQTAADNVGMLATIQNAIVVSEVLKQKNQQVAIFSSFPVDKMAQYYTYQGVDSAMKRGEICFLAGGTGNPFFTTDSAAILRAIEVKADLVLKGTKVDGIYTADPMKDKNAHFIPEITYSEALSKKLMIMDMTAFSLARDYNIPIKVFDITQKGNLNKAVMSKEVGTLVFE